jgi:Uncharacterised nucleotidyltransferase
VRAQEENQWLQKGKEVLPKLSVAEMLARTMRPETELLLCCARTCMDSKTVERVKVLLRAEPDWKYLVQTTFLHGMTPLVYWNLSRTCPDAVPEAVLDKLRRRSRLVTFANLDMTGELLRLLRMLEEHDIPAIPYKGPVLAASVYGNLALRQFRDLDILVRGQDATRAKNLLLIHGYQHQAQADSAWETAFHRLRKVYELVRPDKQILVELHWSITSWTFFFPLNPKHLWERVETVSLAGTPVRNLMSEDLLLILCIHGAKHHWRRLRWICDIAELLRHQTINWGRIVEQASKLGGVRMLYLGLLVAYDLLGAAVPENVLQRIEAEPKVPLLAAQVQSQLFAGDPVMAVERPAFYLQLRERARDRIPCSLYLAYRMLASRAREVS